MRGSQAPSSTALIAVLDLALRDAGAKAAAVAAREAVRARAQSTPPYFFIFVIIF